MRRSPKFLAIFILFANIPDLFGQTSAWFIDTLAGMNRPVNDGGQGVSALLNTPGGVIVDGSGNVIFADTNNHRVRRIATNGTISTIAGTGNPGNSGDSGPAVTAQLLTPIGLALDVNGNLYISDYDANVVRMVGTTGIIKTVAGNGVAGNSGNSGKATAANLNGPYAIALDKAGNLYIAEDLNNAVRKVTPDGTIFAFVGNVSYPEGLAVDASGAVYVSSWSDSNIYKASPTGTLTLFAGNGTSDFAGDGGPATAASLDGPQGIAFDSSGTMWICDSINNRIRTVANGAIQTVIGSGYSGLSSIGSFPSSLSVYLPVGIAVDGKGTVYWSESGNQRVRQYTPGNHQVADLAGYTPALNAGGTASSLLLLNPFASSTDAAGNVYIADSGNNVIRKITPAGVSTVVAGTGDANFNGDVGTATSVSLTSPAGVSVDAQGNIFIADSGNGRVRKVDSTGRITTVMGAGQGLPLSGTFDQNAFLIYPVGVVATGNGAFVVVDEYFGIVASVNALGSITLLPTISVGYLNFPGSVAVSGPNIYIADTYNQRILKYTNNTISVVAGSTGRAGYTGDGGPATQATLNYPYGIAADSNNNLYIADTLNQVIRMVDATGKISTIAGTGMPGFSGDKGVATKAQLFSPTGINVDSSGNLEIADNINQRIRILKYQVIPSDLTIQTDAITKTVNQGGSVPIQITLASAGGFAGTANFAVTAPPGIGIQFAPALPITITAGQTVGVTATAQVGPSVAPGLYTVVFALTAGAVQHSVSVTLIVTNLPVFTSAAVVNAASFTGGGVSPGEIVAIYGQGLGPAALTLGSFDANGQLSTNISGTQVLFDGVPAPLIYSVGGQLSAIVPYEVSGEAVTQVQIQYNGQSSAVTPVNVVDAAPGIFTLPQSTQAAALNTDLTVNGANNPAAKGSIIVLFATGEGQTNPPGVDGRLATSSYPAPQLPITVTIGGTTAIVVYGGAAPYEVAGLLQLNVQIPAGTPSGSAPVVLQVGSHLSATATIAVQ